MLVISIISLIKLMEGGAAMLAAVKINHIIVIIGKMFNIPLVKNRLRVCVISYVMLAAANRPDDVNPCAIIIMRLPCHAQVEFLMIPAVISPI